MPVEPRIPREGVLDPQVTVEAARSTQPRGPHVLNFDRNRGWLRYTFIRRAAEPQIVIENVFWQ